MGGLGGIDLPVAESMHDTLESMLSALYDYRIYIYIYIYIYVYKCIHLVCVCVCVCVRAYRRP
jgi:hypothetical protein